MPYHREKRGDQHCVIKDSDGEVMGCHDTEEEANEQIRALYANEADEAVAAAGAGPDTGDLAMVAVYPRRAEAEALAVEGGLEVEDLHVTLVFLGDVGELDVDAIHEAVSTAALANNPLEGAVGGFGAFAENDDGVPVIALPDVKGLTKLREDAVKELFAHDVESPSEHGFLPHMTLIYSENGERPVTEGLGQELHFDSISVVVGGERTDYSLGRLSEEADMSVIGEAHVKIIPVLDEDALDAIDERLSGRGFGRTNANFTTVTISTADVAEEVEEAPARWQGVLALEGVPTDDNTPTPRVILPLATTWRELPLPLMALVEDHGGQHIGHKLAGRIDEIWRVERPDLGENAYAIMGRGVFDSVAEDETGEYGKMIARLVAEKKLRGVSIDPVAVQWALVESEGLTTVDEAKLTPEDLMEGGYYVAMTSATIGAATVCSLQALGDATIEILTASATEVHVSTASIWIEEEAPMVACAAGPIDPPASFFARKSYRKPTPLFVTDDGEVGGHLATWECHVGFEDRCMRARPSRDGYARFHTGAIVTREGQHLRVGRIQVKPHAKRKMTIDETLAYYSDPKTVAAFVAIWDDDIGIACAGVTRSDAPPELLRDFYANPPSGEWRRGELMGFSCVPLPGLPVTSPEAYLVASVDSEMEIDVLILPGVTEEDAAGYEEIDEEDVRVAAAVLQGGPALAAVLAE